MWSFLLNTSMMHALLVVVPWALAALLRRARLPGWAVIGGVAAGVLMGPTIFGRVWPDQFEQLFVGGIDERHSVESLVRDHEVANRAAAAGLTRDAAFEGEQRLAAKLNEARQSWEQAKWSHQRPLRNFTFVFVAATLLLAGVFVMPQPKLPPSTARATFISGLSVGAWAAGLPAAAAYMAMRYLFDRDLSESIMVAAAVAIGLWVLSPGDREAANRAEIGGGVMVQIAGRVASLAAIGVAALALWLHRGSAGLVYASLLLAQPAGWLIHPANWRRLRWTTERIVVPTLAACIAVKIDFLAHVGFWPIIVLVLLSGDGRWMGAVAGAMIPGGRRVLRTMRLVLGSMAAGPTQLAVTALGLHAGLISERIALALLAGAVLIEATVITRRSMAQRLIRTEVEIDAASEDY